MHPKNTAQITIDEIRRKTCTTAGTRNDLQEILKAGAGKDALLSALAMAVMPPSGKSNCDHMRNQQKQLRSLAGQIRTVAQHAERLALDPRTYLDLWPRLMDQSSKHYRERELKRRAPLELFDQMRRFADSAEKRAWELGRCLRHNAQMERNLGVAFLLFLVYHQTGKTFEAQLARLLTDAAEAAGVPGRFSADRLRKLFRRHLFCPAPHPDKSTP